MSLFESEDEDLNEMFSISKATTITKVEKQARIAVPTVITLQHETAPNDFKERLEDASERALALKIRDEKIKAAVAEFRSKFAEPQCQICYSDQQEALLLPCRHMVCIQCSSKLEKCPWDREPIVERILLNK